ncbi:hypothetical protein [Kitasatospora griseola]|uniref:hypothetical protein n=1 Tax=Kitasatospora griseola TaxID=2064 RepID=UPI003808D290
MPVVRVEDGAGQPGDGLRDVPGQVREAGAGGVLDRPVAALQQVGGQVGEAVAQRVRQAAPVPPFQQVEHPQRPVPGCGGQALGVPGPGVAAARPGGEPGLDRVQHGLRAPVPERGRAVHGVPEGREFDGHEGGRAQRQQRRGRHRPVAAAQRRDQPLREIRPPERRTAPTSSPRTAVGAACTARSTASSGTGSRRIARCAYRRTTGSGSGEAGREVGGVPPGLGGECRRPTAVAAVALQLAEQ